MFSGGYMPRIAQIGALIAALFITLGAGSLHAREPAPLAAYGALPDVEDAKEELRRLRAVGPAIAAVDWTTYDEEWARAWSKEA